MTTFFGHANNTLVNTEIYVLDGGSPLQRLPWPRRAIFNGLFELYIDYITKNYSNSVVVFDGYETGPSTKDNTHLRRSRGKLGAEVHFKEAMFLESINFLQMLFTSSNSFIY